MSRPKILQEGQSYTFRSYFEMPYETDDILAEFGYSLSTQRLQLPTSSHLVSRLADFKAQLEASLQLVRLSSETARREILVAPILLEVARICHSQLRIEYPLTVNEQLKGKLDYLLRGPRNLLVIEAKNDDLSRGFTQLAVELIALSKFEDQSLLYGAVTLGNIWLFGQLNAPDKMITQDLTLYRAPDDLETLMAILVGIIGLKNESLPA
ncbi:MAG: hypothetical protein AAF152_07885 [Cyanobacteria bacterium P01_A01_bin.114]